MPETYVELEEIPVLRIRADLTAKGPAAAFDQLERKLPNLKGRRFYGTFYQTPSGEVYHACVARVESDDPVQMELETGTIAGGWYARRKIMDWEARVSEFPSLFGALVASVEVDPTRPSVEFYRSRTEMYMLVPVRSVPGTARTDSAL